MITYTPETYRVVYRELLDDEVQGPTQASEVVNGTTNLTALNVEYTVVIRNLRPGTSYSYMIVTNNTFTTSSTGSNTLLTSMRTGRYNLYTWYFHIRETSIISTLV